LTVYECDNLSSSEGSSSSVDVPTCKTAYGKLRILPDERQILRVFRNSNFLAGIQEFFADVRAVAVRSLPKPAISMVSRVDFRIKNMWYEFLGLAEITGVITIESIESF
jgi:hypothetical protein